MGLHSSFISIHPEYFVRVQLRSAIKPQILNIAQMSQQSLLSSKIFHFD